uniref:Uncharacterized protein n=1 Tax=Trichobilharzia regenti TaxID=157069 RepID=A0AA85K5M5_TRIRE|nr:unnamed protein product [Trichobilharzia regenti]
MVAPEIMSTNCHSLSGEINYPKSFVPSNVYRNTGTTTLQETCPHDLYDDYLVCLSGFGLFRQDWCSSEKKWSNGVATFINSQWCTSNTVCFRYSSDKIDSLTFKCRPKRLSEITTFF